MSERPIFAKLKDYNKILEQVLEKKYISGNSKNIMLSMAYKIETSYNDYKTVKRNVKTKDEFLDKLVCDIDEFCEHIKLVEPNSEKAELLEKYRVNALTNEKEKSILAFPTEIALLYGVSDITPKYFYIENNCILKKPFQYMLVDGSNQNNVEILKNFNGWSWYNEYDPNINYVNNLIYQNLLMLVGDKYMDEWKENNTTKSDCIKQLINQLSLLYGKLNMQAYYIALCRVLILNSKNKEKLIEKYEPIVQELKLISDKKRFLEYLSINRIELTKKINSIENILSKDRLLSKELRKRNIELDDDKQIKNIKQLIQILKLERNRYKARLDYLNEISTPKTYLLRKEELELQYEIVNDINNADLKEEIIKMQKAFISCMYQKLQNVHTTDDIVDLIYELRYYRNIYLYKDIMVREDRNIDLRVHKLLKEIVIIACKFGIINIFCDNLDYNYEIVSLILETNIIDLEQIKFSLNINSTKNKIKITIFDKDVIEREVELKYNAENKIKVKLKKPHRVFI